MTLLPLTVTHTHITHTPHLPVNSIKYLAIIFIHNQFECSQFCCLVAYVICLSLSLSLYLRGLYICIYHLNVALSTTFQAHLICHNLIQFTIFIASSWQKCENVIKSNCISSAIRLQLSQQERERGRDRGRERERETLHITYALS